MTPDDDDSKPNLTEIDLAQYSNLEEDIEYVQVEHKFNDNEEENEDTTEIYQDEQSGEDEKYEEHSEEEKYDTDKAYEVPPSKKQKKRRGTNFKTRAPKKPKSPITLMCNICGNLYKNKATFNYHMKLHQNDKKYECE